MSHVRNFCSCLVLQFQYYVASSGKIIRINLDLQDVNMSNLYNTAPKDLEAYVHSAALRSTTNTEIIQINIASSDVI